MKRIKPNNYSWIDNTIAGSAKPLVIENIEFYKQEGITDLISLTPKKPLVSKYMDASINQHHFPIYSTPDRKQLNEFANLMKDIFSEGRKAVVHCEYGQERTGIFLAYYLIRMYGLSVKDAISKIRDKRPSSLRTPSSLEFLRTYFS